MNKEIIDVSKELGIKRITTLDERWYARPTNNKVSGLPEYEFFPSTTWIAGYYPKGIAFYKWLAEKGWEESQAIKNAAGDKGSKVHAACSDIDAGQVIPINAKYLNKSSGQMEELTPEEYEAIMSYRDYVDEVKPVLLKNEGTYFGSFWGGTLDKIFAIPNKLMPNVRQIWIVDLKTSKSVWEEYILQISSYSHANIDYKALGITDEEWASRKLAILQVGYSRNKSGYKFTEVPDKFELFEMAYKIWQNENPEAKPQQKDYPLEISSKFRVDNLKAEQKKIKMKKNDKSNAEE